MKKRLLIILLVILSILTAIFVYNKYYAENISLDNSITTNNIIEKKEKVYEHINPERINKTTYFNGEFISNDTASIYPRRESIVKDILVDIGDKVKVGDTLAILLPPGVEGEGVSNINIKNTILKTKGNVLNDTISVRDAKLYEIDSKIIEKEILIKETEKNLNTGIKQAENSVYNKGEVEDNSISNSFEEIKIEEENLKTLEVSLENSRIIKKENIINSENDIKQKKDLLNLKIEEVYSNIIPIFYIGNENGSSYENLDNYNNTSIFFGGKDISLRNELINKAIEFENKNNTLETIIKYEKILEINNMLISTLRFSIASKDLSEDQIDKYIQSVNSYNTSLYSSKENYDDAIKNYDIVVASSDDKINILLANIEKQKKVIDLKSSNSNLVDSGKTEKVSNLELEVEKLNSNKSLQINKLKAERETLIASKKLLESQEKKAITSIQNDIAITKSELNNEYIKSNDYKIVSTFSGIISKRNIEVGQKVSQSNETFRLSGVSTSLSKKAKKEIKFYVPEDLIESIEIGKEIKFKSGTDSNKEYIGTIWRISPEVDPSSLTITVQAKAEDILSIPHKALIQAWHKTDQQIFKIPTSSTYNKGERKIIYYKKENGKLGVKDIEIISNDGEFSLVNGEFDEDLKIVTTPIFIK